MTVTPLTTLQVTKLMRGRIYHRLDSFTDQQIFQYLADTIYLERKRLETDPNDGYQKVLQRSAKSLNLDRPSMVKSILKLIEWYVKEIHTHFSTTTHEIASKVIPGALTRLLTASQPLHLLEGNFDPASRMNIEGPLEMLVQLSKSHTLVFTPTHVSNLDSPLIGYALQTTQLPPVLYGAGLNLFSNPLMGFFMSRLGAYTVDRRKRNQLYKHVLKEYSTLMLEHGHHSLFYPGGTRSRSGSIESSVKKGLLGTLIQAWQNNLSSQKPNGEILVVPCTLTSSLVLEAETLIDDALAEAGKERYIIMDDEFSEKRTLANYARKVLNLDSSIYIRFGTPMDCMGNLVNSDGTSIGFDGQTINRREYVCDDNGSVVQDSQRDFQYTKRLAKQLIASYKNDSIIVSTHLVARAAWLLLQYQHPNLDDVQLALLSREDRVISVDRLVQTISSFREQIHQNDWRHALPETTGKIIEQAHQQFRLFHRSKAVFKDRNTIIINTKLALYYGNRLRHLPLKVPKGVKQ